MGIKYELEFDDDFIIDDSEYIKFLKDYCNKFPNNTLAMAAHTFTFRVKK